MLNYIRHHVRLVSTKKINRAPQTLEERRGTMCPMVIGGKWRKWENIGQAPEAVW